MTAKPTPSQRVARNIRWIEKHCRIPEGKDIGRPVKLRPWQKEWINAIYSNPHGTRLAILSVGRKNAKTTFAAFLLLLHLAGPESEPNGQLYSTAQSKEQASVIFGLAAKIVRIAADLRGCILIRDTARQLFCPERGTLYRALSADVSTAYGLSPSFTVHDELGVVKGPHSGLFEALETATGAQSDPLSVVISTQAPTDNDLLSQLIDDAQRGADPRVVCKLFSAPKDADPFDIKTIRKANPALGDFLNETEVLAMAESARRLPSREADFRNLVLNQRVEQSNPFISKAVWQSCGGEIAQNFDELEAYGGLDLSSANDLTCLVRVANVAGVWSVKPTFWLPEDGLRERARLDKVEYDIWRDQELLETTPGQAIEYDFVAHRVAELLKTTKLKKIAFDPWNWQHFRAALVRQGLSEHVIENSFVEFRQGYKSMSPALLQIESLILTQKMRHANHPVLAMCAGNSVVTRDPAGNRKLDKSKARGRIDGMVALTMAIGIGLSKQQEGVREYKILVI